MSALDTQRDADADPTPTSAAGSDEELQTLESRIGHTFTDRALASRALVHTSAAVEIGLASNQRLEFLGDAALDLAISEVLMNDYPDASEGDLTKMRANLVRAPSLAAIARSIELGSLIRLGRGESRSGGAEKDNILADALEAVLAAVFLDAGYPAMREAVSRLFADAVRTRTPPVPDYKTALQESTQRLCDKTPSYRVVEVTGPSHQPHYHVEVSLEGRVLGAGEGPNRKSAEQQAARVAAERLEEQETPA